MVTCVTMLTFLQCSDQPMVSVVASVTTHFSAVQRPAHGLHSAFLALPTDAEQSWSPLGVKEGSKRSKGCLSQAGLGLNVREQVVRS